MAKIMSCFNGAKIKAEEWRSHPLEHVLRGGMDAPGFHNGASLRSDVRPEASENTRAGSQDHGDSHGQGGSSTLTLLARLLTLFDIQERER